MKREFREIPLSDIVLSGDNARRDIEKSPDFPDLVNSIKSGGVRVPVQVRIHPDKKGKYELRYGERRYAASKAAGLKTMPAIVTDKLSEEDALDLTYIENKFRQGLKPMEEAEEIALLLERFGSAKAVAEKIGKDIQWVHVRANIACGLNKQWKDIVSNPEKHPEFKSWTLTHLLHIARLPDHIQQTLIREISQNYNYRAEKMSAMDLEELIAKALHLLKKAKWELDDETLVPKSGACTKCTKRSGHQPLLWFDSEDQAEAGDQCLDGLCWKSKEMAWLGRQAAELRQKHPNLVLVLTGPTRDCDTNTITERMGAPMASWQYKTCSKSTKGAVPAMYVNNKGAGKMAYVKINEQTGGLSGRIKGTPTSLKQRRAMLDAKRWAQVLLDLREKVAVTKVAEICFDDKSTGLMALVALYGNKIPYHARADVKYKSAEELIKAGRNKVIETLWETFGPTLDDLLTYNGPITQTSKEYIIRAEWIAKLICVDVKAMLKEVSSRKGFTVPKSWAGLNADGTPKKAKAKPEKKADKKT